MLIAAFVIALIWAFPSIFAYLTDHEGFWDIFMWNLAMGWFPFAWWLLVWAVWDDWAWWKGK